MALSRSFSRPVARVAGSCLMLAAVSACGGVPAQAQDAGPTPQGPAPPENHAWVIFGADTVVAEVAGTGDNRSRGLQDRESLPAGTGMLFTFGNDIRVRTFWMKDTPLDLDIAFLDEELKVFQILQMQANSLDLHDSAAPVTMALEVPAGWFAAHGIEVGTQAEVILGR